MIKESKGQIALEYLLIFTISLLLLIVFTLPLAELTIEDTFDVSDSLKLKSDLSKIGNGIETVYGEGQGSKQTVYIESTKDITINVGSNSIYSNLKLKDNSNKNIKITYDSNLAKSSFSLKKGSNTIIIEWPVNSKNMKIYKI